MGGAFERVKVRRLLTWEIILVAIFLSLMVNLASSLLMNAWSPSKPVSLALAGGLLALLVVGGGGFVLYLKNQEETEWDGLRILLPFRIDRERGLALLITQGNNGKSTGYAPLYHAGQCLLNIDEAARDKLFQGHPHGNPLQGDGFIPGAPVWDNIATLIESLLLLLIKEYGNATLSSTARHHGEFRRFADRMKKCGIGRSKWPKTLRESPFLSSPSLDEVWVPEGFAMSYTEGPTTRPDLPRGSRALTLRGKRCSITFSIAMDWSPAKKEYFQGNIAALGLGDGKGVELLIIPVDMALTFRGLHFKMKEMEIEYAWLGRLVDNARRRMHWGEHLRKRGGPRTSDG
jgi:hypothetical protein